MRKFDKALQLPCPKCTTLNDVSTWVLQYVAPVLINEAQNTYTEEMIEVFCQACHYLVESFYPADTVHEEPDRLLTATEWRNLAMRWFTEQEAASQE